MKQFLLIALFLFAYFYKINAQEEPIKLAAEVLNASDDLNGSLEKLNSLKDALKDIEYKKTPKFTDNEWNDLASKYRDAANKIDKAPLPTDFDKKKYTVSANELKECDLKESTLRKLNEYLQELKNAQERGKQAMIIINGTTAKVKVSRELLRYCIDVHEKLGQLPIFGEKFLWDWIELDRDVTDALNIYERALQNQRNKILTEKSKLDLYVPNLESNLFQITKYLNEKCNPNPKQKDNTDLGVETSTNQEEPLSEQFKSNESKNEFYLYLTTTLKMKPKESQFAGLQSPKTLYIISKPVLHQGNATDGMENEKEQFLKNIKNYFIDDAEILKELYNIKIDTHYGKPNSTELTKTSNECDEAIEEYKRSTKEILQGITSFDFLEL